MMPEAEKFKYKYYSLSRTCIGSKELQDALDLDWYDLGARGHDPARVQFGSIDPRAEEYYSQSPYVFAANNPVFFVDINGEGVDTDYKLDKKGNVTRVDENDGSEKNKHDRLFATDNDGNVTGNHIQINKEKASDNTVISDLSWNDNNGNSMSLNNNDADAVYKTFLFAANNSNVEWQAGRTTSNTYFISTGHDTDFSPSASDMMMSNKDIFAYVHSHPGIDRSFTPTYQMYLNMYGNNKGMYYEVSSMGYTIEYGGADWNQVKAEVNRNGHKYINHRYVYMPKSGRLWRVGYHNPEYIRKIRNNHKRMFFGTLKK